MCEQQTTKPWRTSTGRTTFSSSSQLIAIVVMLVSLRLLPTTHYTAAIMSSSTTSPTRVQLFYHPRQELEKPLSLEQISELRVRDIKRRLALTHGFSADELERILDKKELIAVLVYHEEMVRQHQLAEIQRVLFLWSVLVAIAAVVLVMAWPLIRHILDVLHVHTVVYWDRMRLQFSRCWLYQSKTAMVGVATMGAIDLMQLWLTISIFLSWVTTSFKPYAFPIPPLTIRPAAFMGSAVAQPGLSQYGVNVGSFVVTWALRWTHQRIEQWTGRALSNAQHQQQRQERKNESSSDRVARKMARQQAKLEKQQRQMQAVAAAIPRRPPQPPMEFSSVIEATTHIHNQPPPTSRGHDIFLEQLVASADAGTLDLGEIGNYLDDDDNNNNDTNDEDHQNITSTMEALD